MLTKNSVLVLGVLWCCICLTAIAIAMDPAPDQYENGTTLMDVDEGADAYASNSSDGIGGNEHGINGNGSDDDDASGGDDSDNGDGNANSDGSHGNFDEDAGAAAAANPFPHGVSRRHHSYTVEARLRHVLECETAVQRGTVVTIAEYARKLRLSVSSLRRWIRNRDTLLEQSEHDAFRRRIRDDHEGCWPEVEEAVHNRFLDYRRRALPVSRADLQSDAQEQFQIWWDGLPQQRQDEIRIQRPERSHFRASTGWMHHFMIRKRIALRRKNKDTAGLSRDANQRVRRFQRGVRETVYQNNVHAIYNMNETFVQLDFPPLYTAATRGCRSVDVRTSIGNAKVGCTVALTIGSNGEKMPAHVVFREPGFIRQIRALREIPQNLRVTSSRSGWENRETLQHWLDEVFFPFIGETQPNERLLLLDQFRPHMAEEFCNPLVEAGVLVDNIPARCTSLSQPLDVTIMRAFKAAVRRHWKNWKQENTNDNGECPRIPLQDVMGIISRAWDDVPVESAARAFQVAGLTPDNDGNFRNMADELLEDAGEEEDDGIEFIDDFEDMDME